MANLMEADLRRANLGGDMTIGMITGEKDVALSNILGPIFLIFSGLMAVGILMLNWKEGLSD
tara:strand:+ start:288 stop:473 length:186 start_codon:yes stop_codon:yes gene_type:complete